MRYGLQLFSVRDVAEQNFEEALRVASELGFVSVEPAGFYGSSPEQVVSWLQKYNLEVWSTHTGLREMTENFDGVIAMHKAIGCKDIIIPGAAVYTRREIEEFIENVNRWIPVLKAEGISLHYHNHDREFKMMDDGYVPHDELAARTELKFEIDTYWAYVAGKDPIAVLEHYGDRVEFIHLKDGYADRTGKSLGLGTAPVAEVLDYAVNHGKKIVVESEGLEPTGLEEVKRCIDYLKASGK